MLKKREGGRILLGLCGTAILLHLRQNPQGIHVHTPMVWYCLLGPFPNMQTISQDAGASVWTVQHYISHNPYPPSSMHHIYAMQTVKR